MYKIIFSVISCIIISSCVQQAKIDYSPIEVTGAYNNLKLTETSSSKNIEPKVEAQATFTNFNPKTMKSSGWLGTDGGIPEMVMQNLTVFIDGAEIDIPKHLYADFTDFQLSNNSFTIHQSMANTKSFKIERLGSDGAGAYSGTFYIEGGILQRVVIGGLGFEDGSSGNNVLTWIESDRYTKK